ncbi:MAG: flagellar basal body-associated FliL family protein [Gammaproteobacteria bacterium]|nr:flagellar basal body-associated FliL family protein [Gammaproteobacteria bacterium]
MQLPAGICWALLVLAGAAAPAAGHAAQEQATAAGNSDQVHYVPLQESFVTNFGDGIDGRMQFIKADVSLRVRGPDAATAVRYHLPALRNTLVLLLSRQDHAALSSSSGREAIRAEALAEIRAILEAREGSPHVEDVLFTNFIVQR